MCKHSLANAIIIILLSFLIFKHFSFSLAFSRIAFIRILSFCHSICIIYLSCFSCLFFVFVFIVIEVSFNDAQHTSFSSIRSSFSRRDVSWSRLCFCSASRSSHGISSSNSANSAFSSALAAFAACKKGLRNQKGLQIFNFSYMYVATLSINVTIIVNLFIFKSFLF